MNTPQHLFILTGASRGMGLGMAEQLVDAGHTLITISRRTSDALQARAQAAGCALTQWPMDLADGAAAAARLAAWLRLHAPDAFASATLINNAGVIAAIGPLRDADAADLANALRVGLEAPMQLTAAFLGATRAWTGPRKVLNISSGLGRRAMASQAGYCAAKAGMDHFTRCVALDEAGQPGGARVCSLAPGVIDTDMQVQLRGADAAAFPDRGNFERLKSGGQLSSPAGAAQRVLAWLARPDFGAEPVADVRDA
ncbi:SDR family NAD(P)-dependent oxidoreductase [Ottowia sp.]|uniref:SDR family NAD(P)-dependent oxidoreductase n=1 Tax=Ottowia sp. TaxID=1898956 RepID=UPI0026164115|nr:SDR family NAD(P)-dependent oxidoreductase [Ottowia sp.]